MNPHTEIHPSVGRHNGAPMLASQRHGTPAVGPDLLARVAGLFKLPPRLAAQRSAGPLGAAEVPGQSARVSAHARALEAAAVRDYAMRVRAFDPGFASDLLAAAERHELLSELPFEQSPQGGPNRSPQSARHIGASMDRPDKRPV